ncbi:MAG: uracil phosphoribosyltransferase [Bacteroidia bacterium]|nr:uracil phosphoribosyltransferase [Bacteroidia bacterium]
MVHILTNSNSVLNDFIAFLRDIDLQKNPVMFRDRMEMFGIIGGYEISKTLDYYIKDIQTPLGISKMNLVNTKIIIASILRAGLPMHQGLLKVFPYAENAFIGAYRKHHKSNLLEIALDYLSSPSLEGSTLILCDPMLATGKSIVLTLKEMIKKLGMPRHIHILSIIASKQGVDYVKSELPSAHYTLWCGAVDDELSSQYYIVPGLGDAGDLAYGPKI